MTLNQREIRIKKKKKKSSWSVFPQFRYCDCSKNNCRIIQQCALQHTQPRGDEPIGAGDVEESAADNPVLERRPCRGDWWREAPVSNAVKDC